VVPTRGRVVSVTRLLATLATARSRYPGASEVILSDASEGPDAERIRRLARQAGACVVTGPPGFGRQRNLGWRTACGDLIVFVDSDCVAAPDLLRHLVTPFSARSVVAVAGRVRFTGPGSLPLDAAVATGVVAAFDGFGSAQGGRVPWGVTANLAVRGAALAALGGFDERMPAGEDVDLGLRLSRLGEIWYAADALVEHDTGTWDGLVEVAARFFRYGRADPYLRWTHPDVRGGLEPTALPGLLLTLALAVWRVGRRRGRPAVPVGAYVVSLVVSLLLTRPRSGPTAATSALALGLMECLSAGRAAQAVRLHRWSDVACGVVLDEGQREREAEHRRRAWLVAVVPAAVAMVAARSRRWHRSRS